MSTRLNQWPVAKTMYMKFVGVPPIYNFFSRTTTQFALDQKLHQAKDCSITLKLQSWLRIFFIVEISMKFWLVGHVWACSTHFHELVIKQLLFLDKLATTFVKSAQPCKVSKLVFWNSQIVTLQGSIQVKPSLEGILVILIYMNNVPTSNLSVVKV